MLTVVGAAPRESSCLQIKKGVGIGLRYKFIGQLEHDASL